MKKIFYVIMMVSAWAVGGAEAPEHVARFAEGVKELFSGAVTFQDKGAGIYAVLDQDGKTLGTLYLETIADDAKRHGYAGPVEVAILVDNDNLISGVLIGKHQETLSYIRRVRAAGFLKSWNGLTLKEAAGKPVDTVTRATYSSTAIRTGVRNLAATQAGVEAEPAIPVDVEIAQLEKRVTMLTRIVSGSRTLLEQLRNRKDEELELRLVAALNGSEAAKKFAEERKMMFFSHGRPGAEKTPVQLAAEKYNTSKSEEDLKALKEEILAAYEELLDTVPPHNEEQEKALAAAEARLAMLRRKAAPQKPSGMKFRSPEAQAEQANIERLAAAYRENGDPKALEELRAELRKQLDRGIVAMSARIESMEQELARLKSGLAGYSKDPDEVIRKRVEELTR